MAYSPNASALTPAFSELRIQSSDQNQVLDFQGGGSFHDDYLATDSSGNVIQLVALCQTSGGPVPLADIQASAIRAGGTFSAKLTYEFGIAANDPRYPSNIGVPVTVSSAGHASITTGFTGTASAGATFFGNPPMGAAVQADRFSPGTKTDEFSTSVHFSAYPGAEGTQLVVQAQGALDAGLGGQESHLQAIVDPIVVIDPDATFIFDGQPIRFANAYHVEYSDGVVPEPAGVVLALIGGYLCLAGRFFQPAARPVAIASSTRRISESPT
jgi:hypothetical protein